MVVLLPVHVVAGLIGIVSGFFALYTSKGAPLHRRSGIIFVCAMLPMSITGMLISALAGVAPAMNIPAALVTFYLVLTAMTTVRPVAAAPWLDVAGMRMAFLVSALCAAVGISKASGGGAEAGMAFPLFMFGGATLAAAIGDRRMIRAGGIVGAARLRRHLWRMCFALLIATASFFSSPERVPAPGFARALPILAVLFTMFYWLWRMRARQTARGVVASRVPQLRAAAPHEALP